MPKATVTTLKNELTGATISYSDYLESIVNQREIEPVYRLAQVIAIRELIGRYTRIKPLYRAMSDYCQQFEPSFGERWRLFFGSQKNYDLYANLQAVLRQVKYSPDGLTSIEEDFDDRQQMKDELRQEIRQELRQEVLAQPDVIINTEIVRLNELNAKLQAKIEGLQAALRKAEQARDYWQGQYHTMKVQRDSAVSERNKYYSAATFAENRFVELENQKNNKQTYQGKGEQIPTTQSYSRQPPK